MVELTIALFGLLGGALGEVIVEKCLDIPIEAFKKHWLAWRFDPTVQRILRQAFKASVQDIYQLYKQEHWAALSSPKREQVRECCRQLQQEEAISKILPCIEESQAEFAVDSLAHFLRGFQLDSIAVKGQLFAVLEEEYLVGVPEDFRTQLEEHLLDGFVGHFVDKGVRDNPHVRDILFFQFLIDLGRDQAQAKQELEHILAALTDIDAYQRWQQEVTRWLARLEESQRGGQDELLMAEAKTQRLVEHRSDRLEQGLRGLTALLEGEAMSSDTQNPPSEMPELPQLSTSTSFLPIPLTTGFVGRVKELEFLYHRFSKYSTIFVEGFVGIGKTYLAAKFADQLKAEYEVLWFECQPGSSLGDLFEAFGNYAVQYGNDYLREIVRDTRERTTREKLLNLLLALEQGGRFVLFFDNYNPMCDESLEMFVRGFVKYCKNTRLIIISRERLRCARDLFPDVAEILIQELNEEEALDYLQTLGLEEDKEILQQVFLRTGGHPYWMKLFVPLVQEYGYSPRELMTKMPGFGTNLERDLQTLSETLDKDAALLIERFSAFVEPVPKDALAFIYGNGNLGEALEFLKDRFLIDSAPENQFVMHPVSREFFFRQSDYRRECYWLAGEYYLQGFSLGYAEDIGDREVEKKLKAHYYFLKAKDPTAEDIVYNIMDTLYMTGRFEKLMDILNISIGNSENAHFEIRKAWVLKFWGQFGESAKILDKLLNHQDRHIAAMAKRDKAYLVREQGNFDQALEMYEQVLPEFERLWDGANVAMTKHQMATTYHRKGQRDKALDLYVESWRIDKDLGRKSRIPIHLNKVGLLYQETGEPEKAMEKYTECLRIQQDLGLKRSMSETLLHMAMIAEEQGDLADAARLYERSLIIKEDIRDSVQLPRVLSRVIQVYEQLGNLDRMRRLMERENELRGRQ